MSTFETSSIQAQQSYARPFAAPLAKEDLARKAAELMTGEFIDSRIRPLCAPFLNGHRSAPGAEIVQNTGTGRLTIKYELAPDFFVYGKLYGDELGLRCHEANRALWDAGFNSSALYQVPQPIGFLPDYSLLLMRGVAGVPLGAIFDGDSSIDLVSGSEKAAQWLAALHRLPLHSGTADADWDSLKLFRMAGRVVKASANRPDKLDLIRDLLERIEERTARLAADRPFVFTHGRYHHDHVFVDARATAVIDLDRCRPSDPAKDAAEFVRVLRLTAFKESFDMDCAERATNAFLRAYLAQVPQAIESLGCYWATYVFHSLLGGLKKGRSKGQRSWEELEQFYLNEINFALEFGR